MLGAVVAVGCWTRITFITFVAPIAAAFILHSLRTCTTKLISRYVGFNLLEKR